MTYSIANALLELVLNCLGDSLVVANAVKHYLMAIKLLEQIFDTLFGFSFFLCFFWGEGRSDLVERNRRVFDAVESFLECFKDRWLKSFEKGLCPWIDIIDVAGSLALDCD